MSIKVKVPTLESLKKEAILMVNRILKNQQLFKCPICDHEIVKCPSCGAMLQDYNAIIRDKVDKYFKMNNPGVVKCKCGKDVDTLIISDLRVACPFCQKLNALDILSVLSKTPEGHRNVHAVLSYLSMYADKRQKFNNMDIGKPRFSFISIIANKITRGKCKLKLKRPGYLKFYVNPELLSSPKDFDDKYVALAAFAPKALVAKYFGKVAIGLKKDMEKKAEQQDAK